MRKKSGVELRGLLRCGRLRCWLLRGGAHRQQGGQQGARVRLRSEGGRPFSRGVTLVEVLIVVAIMAMLAGGVAFYALPRFRETQITSAKSWALEIRRAVHSWQQINNEVACPTMSQLKQDKIIDAATETNDPWKEPYTLTCSDDEVYVTSKGPDRKQGTDDDIVVPGHVAAESGG